MFGSYYPGLAYPGQVYSENISATIYTDSAVATVILSITQQEFSQYIEAATATVSLSANTVDSLQAIDSGTAIVLLSGSSTDQISAIEAEIAEVDLDATAADAAQLIEVPNAIQLDLSVSSSDISIFMDSSSVVVPLSSNGSDSITQSSQDAVSVLLPLAISSVEINNIIVVLRLTVLAIDVLILTELAGVCYREYIGSFQDREYSALSLLFRRYWSRLRV